MLYFLFFLHICCEVKTFLKSEKLMEVNIMVAVLTRHSVRRNGGTQTWVTSRSRCRGGTGRSPCAAEGSVTAAGWTDWFPPGLPGPQFHSPHQNCKHKKITIKLLQKKPWILSYKFVQILHIKTVSIYIHLFIYWYTSTIDKTQIHS